MLMYALILIGLYLVVGNLLHRVVFRERTPDISTYFQPGQEFYSKAEGFRQKVARQENGFVYGTLEAEPFAAGPPRHIHTGFDEIFEIENGELTIWVDGEVKKLRPGQVAVVQTDALPGRKWNAVIQAIDPLVDANGRSVGIRGCIDNRQLALNILHWLSGALD